MNFNITDLLGRVDQFGQNFVEQSYTSLAAALTAGGTVNVAGLLLTLYVIFWGIGLWAGTATGRPSDHAFRLFRAFLIYAMAIGWGDFQVYVYNFMNDAPSAIGTSLLTTVSANATGTSANLNTTSGVENALQNVWESTGSSVQAFITNLGVLNFGGYIIAMVLLVVVALLIGFAIFLIILSKIFIWLLLALAPIFVLLLLFGYTTQYFTGWVTQLVQYFVLQVLVYAFVAFYLSISQTYFDAVNATNGSVSTTLTEILPLILVAIIGFLLLSQLPGLASGVAGGMPMRAPQFGARIASAVRGAYQLGDRSYAGIRGTLSHAERRAGRLQMRTRLGADQYKNSAAYRAIEQRIGGSN